MDFSAPRCQHKLKYRVNSTMNTNTSTTHHSRREFIRQSTMVVAGAMILPGCTLGGASAENFAPLPDGNPP